VSGLVIVSGASRGLGAALARAVPFAATVIGLSRTPPAGDDRCEHVAADLSTEAGWQTAADLFERELPRHAGERIVCFHNAGTLEPIGFCGDVDPAAYARNVLLNSASPQIVGGAFLHAAAAAGITATLVMISSGAAHKVHEGCSSYCAGKAALEHWVRTVGAEQARRGGCRVLAVRPGVVDTAMQEQIRATAARDFPEVPRFVERHRRGGLRKAEDVAGELWSLLDRALANGTVLDEQDLATPPS
jgi:benzil reductase ((S)-benzoin forming)